MSWRRSPSTSTHAAARTSLLAGPAVTASPTIPKAARCSSECVDGLARRCRTPCAAASTSRASRCTTPTSAVDRQRAPAPRRGRRPRRASPRASGSPSPRRCGSASPIVAQRVSVASSTRSPTARTGCSIDDPHDLDAFGRPRRQLLDDRALRSGSAPDAYERASERVPRRPPPRAVGATVRRSSRQREERVTSNE